MQQKVMLCTGGATLGECAVAEQY